jgi:F0F1-type ATP synthase assembly protein I
MSKTNWKIKAREYSDKNKQLNRRIKELTKSRDEWKEKSIGHKARADKLSSELKKNFVRLSNITVFQ